MKNPMVHFEIPADDLDRASDFYTKTFDWKIKKVDMPSEGSTEGQPYYMVYTTEIDENNMTKTPGAINGGMMKRQNPGQVFTNYISTNSIDESLKQVEANGGKTMMPKTEIGPNMGWIAMFTDTEGNVMGLHEMSEEMKKSEELRKNEA